jgi:hypothetical protein
MKENKNKQHRLETLVSWHAEQFLDSLPYCFCPRSHLPKQDAQEGRHTHNSKKSGRQMP